MQGQIKKMDKKELVNFINSCIAADKMYRFYKTKEWIELKNKILEEEHFECEICREAGKYKRAYLVHHVRFVRKYPHLALSKYYTYKGKRYKNLLALCNDCHEKIHDRNSFKNSTKEKFKNEERW